MENIKSIKKIDIHAHSTLFPQFYPPYPSGTRFIAAEELLAAYDEIGVEKGVLLSISSPEGQMSPLPSETCKYLADQYPDRFLWFCNVDPRAYANKPTTNLGRIIEFYKGLGAKGVGEITARIYADDPRMENLFAACEACEMPATIHIAKDFDVSYGIVDEIGLPRIEKILKNHPNLKLLGHSQTFWCEMSADITEDLRGKYPTGKVRDGRIAELMRNYPNLYCDLSAGSGANALKRDKEYAAKFIEEFADRILFGMDICVPNTNDHRILLPFLEEMVAEGLVSLENYKKIVRDNAVRLLGLDEK